MEISKALFYSPQATSSMASAEVNLCSPQVNLTTAFPTRWAWAANSEGETRAGGDGQACRMRPSSSVLEASPSCRPRTCPVARPGPGLGRPKADAQETGMATCLHPHDVMPWMRSRTPFPPAAKQLSVHANKIKQIPPGNHELNPKQ